jgi:hypothetical protein
MLLLRTSYLLLLFFLFPFQEASPAAAGRRLTLAGLFRRHTIRPHAIIFACHHLGLSKVAGKAGGGGWEVGKRILGAGTAGLLPNLV